jgi:phage terminase large subunit
MYRRRGAKVIAHESYAKKDTVFVANAAWDLAGRDSRVVIKVDDSGLGGGVTDNLRQLGANVVPINFGGAPYDRQKYTTVADELWFEFPVDEIQIPDDAKLMEELAGRKYGYDKIGRRKIEPKDEFRKRYGRSPDKADALLLCFYTGYRQTGSSVTSARIAYGNGN